MTYNDNRSHLGILHLSNDKFLSLRLYVLRTRHFILKAERWLLSINSFVLTNCFALPNSPSSTSLFVSVPSSVPVNPNRYLQSTNLVIIEVSDLALKRWHSSPITTSKSLKIILTHLID
jgi:hypothetical protein